MAKKGSRKKPKWHRVNKVGTRQITSKPVVPTEGRYKGMKVYRKSGGIHEISTHRDYMRKAKTRRERGDPTYTGDLKGSRI